MKRKPIAFLATFALSVTLISGLGYAAHSTTQVKETVSSFEGQQFHTIGIDPKSVPHSANAIELEKDLDKIMAEQERGDAIAKVKEVIKAKAPENDAGSYIDDDGNVVFLLTSPNAAIEKNMLAAKSAMPVKMKFDYVKYTEAQLREANDAVHKTDVGIVLSMINIKKNKVTIYISEEQFNKNKEQIIKYIPEDMLDVEIAEYKFVDQAVKAI